MPGVSRSGNESPFFSDAPGMKPPRHLQLRLLHAVLLASTPNQPNPMKCPPLLHSAGKKRFHNRPQPNRTHPSSLFLSLSWSDAVTFNIIGGHRIPQTTVPHPSCQPMTVSQPGVNSWAPFNPSLNLPLPFPRRCSPQPPSAPQFFRKCLLNYYYLRWSSAGRAHYLILYFFLRFFSLSLFSGDGGDIVTISIISVDLFVLNMLLPWFLIKSCVIMNTKFLRLW